MPQTNPLLERRFTAPGPKRILSLDGGGIRGALTLGYLEKIEEILKEKHKNLYANPDDFRLCHYFDLIGGTSTGAIIASALVIGLKTSEIVDLYKTLGREIFAQKKYKTIKINLGFWKKIFILYTNYKYDSSALKKNLESIFKDYVLGDTNNKTGLCIVAKRFDTFSTWPVTNNPNARYFDKNRFLLKNIIRASTAAPTFFMPEALDVGDGKQAVFVDGGMSLMNNPSLQLLLIASVKGYNISGKGVTWKTGENELLIASIGTGRREKNLEAEKWKNPNLAKLAPQVSEQFMNDANELVEIMMQYMGKCPEGHVYRLIDREIGTLKDDKPGNEKSFTYLRYNVDLIENTIKGLKIADLTGEQIGGLIEMDKADNVDTLIRVGRTAAADDQIGVKHADFPDIFNISKVYDDEVQMKEASLV